MNVPSSLRADLMLLDDVLDGSASGIATTLMILIEEAESAVPSHLGLAVFVPLADGLLLEITTLENDRKIGQIGSSLRLGVHDDAQSGEGRAVIELLLLAGRSGAFVDLAADITWMTGRSVDDIRIDADLDYQPESIGTTSLASWSTVNQALGVLIGSGMTVDEAHAELDKLATATGMGRHLAAVELLAKLPFPDVGVSQ
ncbi:MAG: hypothetical protein ABIN55_01180 [Aeromicrobium sp.]